MSGLSLPEGFTPRLIGPVALLSFLGSSRLLASRRRSVVSLFASLAGVRMLSLPLSAAAAKVKVESLGSLIMLVSSC